LQGIVEEEVVVVRGDAVLHVTEVDEEEVSVAVDLAVDLKVAVQGDPENTLVLVANPPEEEALPPRKKATADQRVEVSHAAEVHERVPALREEGARAPGSIRLQLRTPSVHIVCRF